MKYIKNEKKKISRTLTKRLRLGLGRNIEWKKVFGEKVRFESREKRERLRYLSLKWIRSNLRHI